MSPSASESMSMSSEAVLQHLLSDGEVVLRTIKPSAWFVLLTSVKALAVLALIGASGHYLGRVLSMGRGSQALEVFCCIFAGGRLIAACCQWSGTLYVLTNRRVLRIRGGIRVAIVGCALTEIRHTTLLATGLIERLVRVGTLFFQTDSGNLSGGEWLHVSRPREVLKAIDEAISHAI
jgi:hypothetical protein